MVKTNCTTLKDLASVLNVSISTVSKALSDSPEISVETKKRIVELAKSLNYKPNIHASALRNKRSLILGVILPDLRDVFFLDSLNGIVEESSKNDYKIMVYQSCNDYKKEIANTNLLSDSNIIDGLIFSPIKEIVLLKQENHIEKVINKGVPIIYIKKNITSNILKENGFKVGQDCVKELLSKINLKHLDLSA